MLAQHIERHVQQQCVRVASNHASLQLALIAFPIIEGGVLKCTRDICCKYELKRCAKNRGCKQECQTDTKYACRGAGYLTWRADTANSVFG